MWCDEVVDQIDHGQNRDPRGNKHTGDPHQQFLSRSEHRVSLRRLQVTLEPAIGLLDGIVFVARLAHEQRPGWRRLTLQRAAAFRAFAGWEQARHGVWIYAAEFRVCALVDT